MSRAMKYSGYDWIGQVPESWLVLPAQRGFTEIRRKNIDGAVQKALQFKFGTIIPKTNFDAESDDYVADTITTYNIVEPGTVMINGLNLNYDFKTQRSALVKETGVITSAYLALWPDTTMIIPEFATYLFKGYETKMALHNMGSGIRLTLGWKEFKKQPVLFPSIQEQQCIVSFLDRRCAEIDAVIEKTKVTIEEYKKLKQSVITEAVTKGIRGNRAMKDSGIEWIGDIPCEWSRDKVVRIFKKIGSGTTPKSSDDNNFNGDINWLQSGDINGGIITASKNHISQNVLDMYSALKVYESPFIIIAMYGASIGNISISQINACVNQAYCVLSESRLNFNYAFYALRAAKNYLIHKGIGGGQPNISQDIIKQLWLPTPDLIEQHEIVEFLDEKCMAMDRLILAKEQLLAELESYRKSVIYEYVTGKKEVPACQ